MVRKTLKAVGILAGMTGFAAMAGERPTHAVLFEQVTRCQTLTDDAARLKCYDGSVAALNAAERRHEVTIVDRAQVQKARETFFGFSLPSLAVFSGKSSGSDELERIDTALKTVAQDGQGRWIFQIADGARWRQIDDNIIARRPRPGDKITIRRAALGSFKLSVGEQPAVKARRED